MKKNKKDKRTTFKEKLDDLSRNPLLMGPVMAIIIWAAIGSLIIDAFKSNKTKK